MKRLKDSASNRSTKGAKAPYKNLLPQKRAAASETESEVIERSDEDQPEVELLKYMTQPNAPTRKEETQQLIEANTSGMRNEITELTKMVGSL